MSSNAALAAAKRRRNISFSEPNSVLANANTNANNTNSIIKASEQLRALKGPVTPGELIKNHDLRLFHIEQKLDQGNAFVTKADLETLILNPTSSIDNITINKLDTNVKEITQLKSTITKHSKSLQDVNSLVTTLRATLLSQTAEINDLKQFKLEFAEFIKNKSGNNDDIQVTEGTDDVNSEINANTEINTNNEINGGITLQVHE